MKFNLLGPLEIRQGDRRLTCAGAKQRLLLGVLLLHANEVVSSDRLIEALWGERPPETARKALQMHVSQLRDLLEPDRARGAGRILVTRPPGYELRVENGQLDLHRFERAVAEARVLAQAGDAQEAARVLRDALALWRGPPLADLSFESFLQEDIARLEELHLAALEDRIDAELELGRHADVVGELEALASQHPLRERVHSRLMLALYRSGRQAEALEAYRNIRRQLVDELGIEPGKELRELEEAILRQDPMLDHAGDSGRAAAQLPQSVFVGRERELETLIAGLDGSLAGHGALYLLVGEPGIGKSRLAEELAGHARARGAGVLVGRCWEAGGAPAYWPWVQCLRAQIRETEPETLRTQLDTGAEHLAQLLPELRDLFPDLPQPPALEPEGARVRLFDATTGFLKRAASTRPLVLVLDDLHAADAPSLLLLRFLARELSDSQLLVIGAYRDVDPTVREPLAPTLAALARESATDQIALAGFSDSDVADYIELAVSSAPPPQLVERIHHETEGNPLFVTEVVRLLDAEGQLVEGAKLSIPPSVRAVIGERMGRLSAPCQRVLVLASVLGRGFGLDAVAQLSALRRDELLEILDEAMAERVVGGVPGSPGQLRFAHALIRDTLYDELTPARRMKLHRQAGEALEAVYATDIEPHLAELAHHFFAAAPAGSEDQAIRFAWRAGDRAASQLAYEEAARLYEMALTLVEEDVARCELHLALGEVRARAGDTRAAKEPFRDAAELAEGLGLAEHLARAALGYGGRLLWDASRDDESLVPLLERALAAQGDRDSTLRARLLAKLAGGPLRDASFGRERKAALGQEGLEMARRIGDRATVAYALGGYIEALQLSPDYTPEVLERANELVEVALEVGDKELAWDGCEHLFCASLELGDPGSANEAVEAMARLAEQLRQPAQDWGATVYRALLALLEGRLAEAEQLILRARSLGERAVSWNAAVSYGLQVYLLRWEQGRLEEVEELVRASVEEYPTYPIWRCVLAHMAAELGHGAESRDAFEGLAADDFSGLPFDEEWLVGMGFLAETARLLGDTARAAVLYRLLLPYAERVAVAYPEISTGSVARGLGLLAGMLGRWDEAVNHFESAVQVNRHMGARSWVAHTRHDYALMLLERAGPGDRERASGLLAEAEATCGDLGMETWAARAHSRRNR
jgi:DNA-binding SARP family transcriptional activator